MTGFASAAPATVRAQINRGIAAARARQAANRVDTAVRDMPRRTANRFRAERLAEYRAEYESRAWGYVALGVAIGAVAVGIAVGVML